MLYWMHFFFFFFGDMYVAQFVPDNSLPKQTNKQTKQKQNNQTKIGPSACGNSESTYLVLMHAGL